MKPKYADGYEKFGNMFLPSHNFWKLHFVDDEHYRLVS